MERIVPDARAMEALGAELAIACPSGSRLHFEGDLGAGKTTLVRGFLRGLGYTGLVKSPTFTLVESYRGPGYVLHHFDLYRLETPEALAAIGYRDYLETGAYVLVEWPEKAEIVLGPAEIRARIRILDEGRAVTFQAQTPAGAAILGQIEARDSGRETEKSSEKA
jgi:tRNA threonylcarbamoyladenosine biosynthesis protein TsaE